MILATRPTSYKIFTSTGLICLLVVFCFNWYIWQYNNDGRKYDSEADIVPGVSKPKPNPQENITPSPSSIATITIIDTITKTETIPTPTATSIPEKLWYKLGPKGLSDDAKGWVSSCLDKNPSYRREFLTDTSGDQYVLSYFSHRPDIIDTYFSFSIPILKADLLRYLILYAEGGIWSDLDVSCEEGVIQDWIPEKYKSQAAVVVGLEFDWAWEDDGFLHSQFTSWTIMSRPRSPHMMMVVDDIVSSMQDAATSNNVSISRLTMDMLGDVVDATGPKRMTRSVVKSMELQLGQTVDDRNISGLLEPKLIGDVLIMPGAAFAARQCGYPTDQGPKYVEHHYAGTWKNTHGGEMS